MVLGLLLGLDLWVDQREVADTPTPGLKPKRRGKGEGHEELSSLTDSLTHYTIHQQPTATSEASWLTSHCKSHEVRCLSFQSGQAHQSCR